MLLIILAIKGYNVMLGDTGIIKKTRMGQGVHDQALYL